MRRDLHDGLGAALAGVVLQMSAARTLLVRDPDAAAELLDKLRVEVQDAITDIRRQVYDLRPPQLDELGLVAAIQELVSRLTDSASVGSPQRDQRLNMTVETPTSLPPLQAAVEVAAYRIAAEALTNVVRHARPRTAPCTSSAGTCSYWRYATTGGAFLGTSLAGRADVDA